MSADVIELRPSTIAKLALGPGDIVVVRCSDMLTASKAQILVRQVEEAIGDATGRKHKVIVLAPNLSISKIEKTPPVELPPGPDRQVRIR